jgi:signal transduction histidine kinase
VFVYPWKPERKRQGMVLHELRSPLHGIIGLANTLSQETPWDCPIFRRLPTKNHLNDWIGEGLMGSDGNRKPLKK